MMHAINWLIALMRVVHLGSQSFSNELYVT